MATARDARDWAHSTLRGIGNSLYTPFCGKDGDDIDWDAYRTLVRYCVGELKHPMLWCTSGIAEFWSLTIAERKQLLEVAIEEGLRADPDVVVQACTAATAAKDCLDLTQHARQAGADIAYIQTPMMEAHGGEGVLNAESARIYSEIPAVCATKEGAFRPASSRLLYELAPSLTICAEKSGLDQFGIDMKSWFTRYPGRPDYFTHWGGAFKYAAWVLGLRIGDYPHSRPPQAEFPAEGKAHIDAAYRRFGLVSS